MARSFYKLGLRRDLNLTDLPNKRAALNNLLAGLGVPVGESFVSEDLDVIRKIQATTLVNEDMLKIAGAALKETVYNPETLSVESVLVEPVVKLKDRLEYSKFTIGEAPYFFGGNGLTARYFESSEIDTTDANTNWIFGEEVAGALPASDIFGSPANIELNDIADPVYSEIFWEQGRFSWIAQLHPALTNNIYGGVEWNGVFKPTENGSHTFNISSNHFHTFEFQTGESGYNVLHRRSLKEIQFIFSAISSGTNTIQLTEPLVAKTLMEGDILINPNYSQFQDPEDTDYEGTPITISEINYRTGEITLSSAFLPTGSDPTTISLLTSRMSYGVDGGSIQIPVLNLRAFQSYNIRIRYWIPDLGVATDQLGQLSYNIGMSTPTGGGTYLRYTYLYSENYPNDAGGDFLTFYNKRINNGGGFVGGSGSARSNYEQIQSTGILNISYEPPTDSVRRVISSFSIDAGALTYTNDITDQIEAGNFLYAKDSTYSDVFSPNTIVTAVNVSESIFPSNPPNRTASGGDLTVIDHRGLVAYDLLATIVNGTITFSGNSAVQYNLGFIKYGDIIRAGRPLTQTEYTNQRLGTNNYYKSVSGVNYSTVTDTSYTGSPMAVTGTWASGGNPGVFFYRPIGLRNKTMDTLCGDVRNATLTADIAAAGATSFTATVKSYEGIPYTAKNVAFPDSGSYDYYIQHPNFTGSNAKINYAASSFSAGVATIVLASGYASTGAINSPATFAIARVATGGTPEDRQICFPQNDTAPPFISENEGLRTINADSKRDVDVQAANAKLKFVALELGVVGDVTVETVTSSDQYDRLVQIETGKGSGDTYYILGSST